MPPSHIHVHVYRVLLSSLEFKRRCDLLNQKRPAVLSSSDTEPNHEWMEVITVGTLFYCI